MRKTRRPLGAPLAALAVLALGLMLCAPVGAQAQPQEPKKPNILVIFGDDIGVWNVSAYHRGMMGGRTPSIDRLATEGALFTDYYGQQSCTAGQRAIGRKDLPDPTTAGDFCRRFTLGHILQLNRAFAEIERAVYQRRREKIVLDD